MTIAVIDMGTNTFHLLIAEVEGDGYEVMYRDRQAVRIGEGGISEGRINPPAMERAIRTLREFRHRIDEYGASKVFATATSAVRSAKNGNELVERVLDETGIAVKVISGDEEAEAIYHGVTSAVNLDQEDSLIMDVGGGSLEFVIGNHISIKWKRSFEMGGQRLLDKFHRSDPIDAEELSQLNSYIRENLEPLFDACLRLKPKILIGSSGTFDTLSEIFMLREEIKIDPEATELPLTVAGFNEIFEILIKSNRDQRLAIPGMIEMRVDMIVVASVVVNYIINQLGIERIRVSSYALKEGILMKIISSLNSTEVNDPSRKS